MAVAQRKPAVHAEPLEARVVTASEGSRAFFSHLTESDFANEDALAEAARLYGDDPDRELADLEAGRHPLQRARA